MSKHRFGANAVVEWSPNHVSWVDGRHQLHTAASLQEAAGQLPGKDLLVAISRRSAFVRAYRVPNAGKEEVRRILSMQIGSLFPIPANELAFDFHLTHDVNSEGCLAIVSAMRSSDLHAMHDQAKAAGLRIAKVVPSALGSVFLAQASNVENAAVVHRTSEGLAIDLIVDKELRYSRVASIPSDASGISAEVKRTFAAAVVGISPTIAAGALAIPEADYSTDTWSLETLLDANIDIDLETPEQVAARTKKRESQKMRTAVLILAGALVTLTFVYITYTEKVALSQTDVPFWTRKLNNLKKDRDKAKSKLAEAQALLANLERGFRPAQSISDVVTVASNATPPGVWLTGFSLERGKSLSLRGTATKGEAVSEFQQALVDEKRFRDVNLLFASNTEIDKAPVVQFSISLFPVGNLPLIDPEAKKKRVAAK